MNKIGDGGCHIRFLFVDLTENYPTTTFSVLDIGLLHFMLFSYFIPVFWT